MTEHRWSKFWWADYEGDDALRVVSLAAQGLWMRMLCAMHKGTPYGHLTINGKQPTVRQIALMASTTEREATRLIAELEEAGVFSRADDGTILNRRMVRDKAVIEKAREDGKRGGNPALKPEPTGGVNPPDKGGAYTLEAEAEAEAEREKEISLPVPEPADVERAETAAEPQWPPPPLPSAIAATVGVLTAKLEGRHRDTKPPGPVAPRRTAEEQVAALGKPKLRAHYASEEALKRARADLALRAAPAEGNA